MRWLELLAVFVLSLIGVEAQYNQYNTSSSPYDRDRDRQDRPYDRQNQSYDRDRQNQYDRDRQNQYDRSNPQYGQQYDRQDTQFGPPYNRQNQQYNQSQPYGRQNQYGNQSQYGNQGPPYNTDRDRDQYGNNRQPYGDPNRDQYGSNRDQYGNNRDQYGNNRDQYGNNRDQYGNNRDQYGNNRDQYGNTRDPSTGNRDPQYGGNRDSQYGGNKDSQYGGNRDSQYGGNRDQYGGSRGPPYSTNRDQYNTGNRDQQYGGGSDFGGPQYGSPLSDPNDSCCQEYCYIEDVNPYVHFATKTAYQVVQGKSSNQHKIPECTPIQFWSINRHGTRYPSARAISNLRQLKKLHQEILKNYDSRGSFPNKGRLCLKDVDLFRRWHWNETLNEGNANTLTRQGIDDLKLLARRYSSRFEELMREPYSETAYSFQYTDTDRTHDSYQAYIEGLFQENAYRVHANVFNVDRLIKPTGTCNAWQRQVEENQDTMFEYNKFKHSPDYQQMVRDVFRRLGFRYTLNESILSDMYDLCRFEKAWNLNNHSPWCIVFNKEQLKLLEYAEDLKYYYKGGYGSSINRKIGCPPLKDLYEKFERTVNGATNGNKVTVFFTHSITIQTFLTAMGIAEDNEPLRGDNYFRQGRRKWRTSVIDPFASNLAAVLYRCTGGETYRVMFFLNEIPVEYPECSVGLCNWSTVKNKLQSASENCNLDFCDQNSATALQRNYVIYMISFVAILFSFRH